MPYFGIFWCLFAFQLWVRVMKPNCVELMATCINRLFFSLLNFSIMFTKLNNCFHTVPFTLTATLIHDSDIDYIQLFRVTLNILRFRCWSDMRNIWKWNLKSLSKQYIITLWKVIRAPLKEKWGLTFFSDFKSEIMSEFRLFSRNADFNLRLKVKGKKGRIVKKKSDPPKNVSSGLNPLLYVSHLHQFVKNVDLIL